MVPLRPGRGCQDRVAALPSELWGLIALEYWCIPSTSLWERGMWWWWWWWELHNPRKTKQSQRNSLWRPSGGRWRACFCHLVVSLWVSSCLIIINLSLPAQLSSTAFISMLSCRAEQHLCPSSMSWTWTQVGLFPWKWVFSKGVGTAQSKAWWPQVTNIFAEMNAWVPHFMFFSFLIQQIHHQVSAVVVTALGPIFLAWTEGNSVKVQTSTDQMPWFEC